MEEYDMERDAEEVARVEEMKQRREILDRLFDFSNWPDAKD